MLDPTKLNFDEKKSETIRTIIDSDITKDPSTCEHEKIEQTPINPWKFEIVRCLMCDEKLTGTILYEFSPFTGARRPDNIN